MHVHAVGHAWLLGAMKREERRPILVSVNEEERWGGSTELNIHAHDHIRVYGKVNMHLLKTDNDLVILKRITRNFLKTS